jgi:16S rRNA processing protein RimM
MTFAPPPPSDDRPAGSPPTGGPAFLVIGKLSHPHGVRGELMMEVYTDFPERIHPGVTVFVGSQYTPYKIRSRRRHRSGLLVAFQEYGTPEAAGALRNQLVYVRAEDRPPLPEGEFYHHQVIGLRVKTESGQPLGVVKDILETGANDILVVRRVTGAEILIPAVDEFVLAYDLARGEVIVRLLPGLLPE